MVVDKIVFILNKQLSVEKYGENGFPEGKWMTLEPGTVWKMTDDNYIDGDVHLEGDGQWLEISEETFREYFSAQNDGLGE